MQQLAPEDRPWVRRALELARQRVGHTSPNPTVGAVLVRDGTVVGEGYHPHAGGPHAEIVALHQAGERARGATLYVTLEPCAHWGRTPPCAPALVAAGVQRVVACRMDPNPRVNGRGFRLLANGGVSVALAPPRVQEAAARLNAAYEKFITRHLPYVALKMAMTLDGKTASVTGASRWITGESARALVHSWRWQFDAVMVGVGTVLADDPLLTARPPEGPAPRQPVRIVVDSLARTPPGARLLRAGDPMAQGRVVIATTPRAPLDRRTRLEGAGAQVWVLPAMPETGRVDLHALMRHAADEGITGILVEGGSTLNAALLQAGLVDRLWFFIAPKLLGGQGAPTAVGGAGIAQPGDALRLARWRVARLPGGDLLIDGEMTATTPAVVTA